jgi:hypothetical protein
MGQFNRKFDVERLKSVGVPKFFTDYLKLWAPAGTQPDLESGRFLRLAVRDGYLNFYYQGQSIGKIEQQASGKLKLSVHEKYLRGTGQGQNYAEMKDEDQLLSMKDSSSHKYEGTKSLRDWARESRRYSGFEKRGVDALLSNSKNANVIDFEMGLPSRILEKGKKRSAPRMDIVALENNKIVFWEAKTLDDSRLRASSGDAEVITQLQTYAAWINDDANNNVGKAYQNCNKILQGLHALATNSDKDMPDLGDALRTGVEEIVVDPIPRLVCFSGCDNNKDSWVKAVGNWEEHRKKLTIHPNKYVIVDYDESGTKASNDGTAIIDPAKIVLSVR